MGGYDDWIMGCEENKREGDAHDFRFYTAEGLEVVRTGVAAGDVGCWVDSLMANNCLARKAS